MSSELRTSYLEFNLSYSSKFILAHHTPSKKEECESNYIVQLDKVDTLIIWY